MNVLGRPGCRRAGRRTGVVHGLLAAATVAGAVYGYRVPLAMPRVPAFGRTALPALSVIAFAPGFTTAALPETGGYPLGGYGPTWLLAAVAAGLSGPIAFITLLGDHTRYISPAGHSSRRVLHATWPGLTPGLLVPQLFGTFTAYASGAALEHADPLVSAAPGAASTGTAPAGTSRRPPPGRPGHSSGSWRCPCRRTRARCWRTGGDCSFLLSGPVGGVVYALSAPGVVSTQSGADAASPATCPTDSGGV